MMLPTSVSASMTTRPGPSTAKKVLHRETTGRPPIRTSSPIHTVSSRPPRWRLRSGAAPDEDVLLRRREARVAAHVADRAVGIEVDLPVVVVVTVGTHRQHGAERREREDLDVGRG